MARTPGIDVSYWQGAIDWAQVAAAGWKYAFIRATMGTRPTDVDENFYANWDGARSAGLLVSPYLLVKPDLSGAAQAERLMITMGERKSDLPIALDVELTEDQLPDVVSAVLQDIIAYITTHEGRAPVIYTRKSFWDPNVLAGAQWAACDLWVAHYGVESPAIPRDWTAWKFWQWSSTEQVPGVGSANCDANWFDGSYEDLLAYARRESAPLPLPVREVEINLKARVLVTELRVRSGPGLDHPQVDSLHADDVVNITDINGSDVWVEVAPGKWAAFIFQGQKMMRLE
ncbi:MAG: hypothetical protein GYB65_18900 [Chloroflexi bacterium]|nr:hypothetical protein [Chloroflexota bacterium]